jgi:hypothetical protein
MNLVDDQNEGGLAEGRVVHEVRAGNQLIKLEVAYAFFWFKYGGQQRIVK